MKKSQLLLIILLIVALAGGIALVNKNQDTRRGAAFGNTTLQLIPDTKIIKTVGDIFPVSVTFTTSNNEKVDGVQTVVCYNNLISLMETDSKGNADAGFQDELIISVKSEGEGKCATVVALPKATVADEAKRLSAGSAMILKFKALSPGEGAFTLDKTKSEVTGINAASGTDKVLTVTSVTGTTYQINGEALTGEGPVLNYKVSFAYVKAGDAKCAVDWPMQVIVLGSGASKVYTNVIPGSKSEADGKVIFQGSFRLDGFTQRENLAVFFKGSKHLQRKYAINNQSGAYGKAGGEITLTDSAETSPLYDFSAYPMIPGDVKGPNTDTQDGWISGVDYSYVKGKAAVYETVDTGGYLLGDLDGNCQVNSNDVNELKKSLEEKQEELY